MIQAKHLTPLQAKISFLTLFLLAIAFVTPAFSQTAPNNEQPNILWIVAEDMSPHLSCFGETAIETPNLDQLAREGVRYTNVYTTAGVCSPSRAAIITGMYQTAIGANNMRTLARSPAAASEAYKDLPLPYSVVLPPEVKAYPEYLRMAGYYCTNNSKEDYQFRSPVTIWDQSDNKAHWRNRPSNKPFFSIFNLNVTHESQLWAREDEALAVDPADVEVPPYYPDVPKTRNAIARQLSNVVLMDQQVGEIIDQLKEDGLYDNTIIFFYSDHGDGLPFVKREVLKRGLHVPMIIRFPNEAQAGTVNEQLISAVDFAPTLLSLAGFPIPEHMHGRAFLGQQKAKDEREYIFAGRDRVDSELDHVRSVMNKRFQYIYNYMPEKAWYMDIKYRLQIPMMQRMISMRDSGLLNKQQMRWFTKPKPKEELYDLEKDPWQLNNLAADRRYRKQLKQLRRAFKKWTKRYGDKSLMPEAEMVKQMWKGQDEAPSTAEPVITREQDGIRVACNTPGASIGYKIIQQQSDIKDKSNWKIYRDGSTIPLKRGDEIAIQAQRIGYRPATAILEF